jgi:dTDP-4-dehydrorhamnose reductase
MKLLVVGGTGLVGTHVVDTAIQRGHEVSWTYFSSDVQNISHAHQLDKTKVDAVDALIANIRPDAVVDTAAFHDVDACEVDRARAWSVNAQGTRNVAAAANAIDAHYIYISTDYVFAGDSEHAPYTEEKEVNPVNYYAQTKYAGEVAARLASTWTVLRTSVVYGLAKPNFITWVVQQLRESKPVSIVNDQISTPTYAPDLAEACVKIVESATAGIYHAAGPESLSRYEFTLRLANVCGFDVTLIDPISTKELGQYALRPSDGSLDSSRLYELMDREFTPPDAAFSKMALE